MKEKGGMLMSFEQEITLQYYNNNAQKFVQDTQKINFRQLQQEFLSYIPLGGNILDFGCGAGRDSKYFLSKGYKIQALDGAEKMALLAEQYIKQAVLCQSFLDFYETDAYNGIWACASLLHLPWYDLRDVLHNLANSLHNEGIFYASFKYGVYDGMRNGRYFTDMTEERWQKLMRDNDALKVLKLWITTDVRKERSDDRWLNILCKKQ
ncbi:class I SAM-dependent methyltransferase [Selenomonas ruminis]|nr:class I SAM-dependent methyltransferase [Selenomonas sp. mPRGC5]